MHSLFIVFPCRNTQFWYFLFQQQRYQVSMMSIPVSTWVRFQEKCMSECRVGMEEQKKDTYFHDPNQLVVCSRTTKILFFICKDSQFKWLWIPGFLSLVIQEGPVTGCHYKTLLGDFYIVISINGEGFCNFVYKATCLSLVLQGALRAAYKSHN